MTQNQPAASPRAAITNPAEARRLIEAFTAAIEDLVVVLDEEAALIAEGKLKSAAAIGPRKQEKADAYVALMLEAKAAAETLSRFAPAEMFRLRKRHHLLKADLQINMAVLETAHHVAEDLMRRAAAEVEAQRTPQLYGSPFARPQPSTTARGIAVDRSF